MTDLIDTVQLQEIDDELVELFDVTLPGYDSDGGNGNYFLFNGFDENNSQISFNSKNYSALPIQITGIEINSAGAHSRPTLTIANIPALTANLEVDVSEPGDVTTLDEMRQLATAGILEFDTNDDLVGTKVVYRKTLVSKLASGEEFPAQTFFIDRIASETNLLVTFELASPMDVEGAKIPARMVIGQYCPWQYQGIVQGFGGGCSWSQHNFLPAADTAVVEYKDTGQRRYFKKDDTEIILTTGGGFTSDLVSHNSGQYDSTHEYSAGNIVYTEETGNTDVFKNAKFIWEALTTSTGKDPRYTRRYWKRIDLCGKTLNSCKIRYQGSSTVGDATLDKTVPLPFGGFPGSKKYR